MVHIIPRWSIKTLRKHGDLKSLRQGLISHKPMVEQKGVYKHTRNYWNRQILHWLCLTIAILPTLQLESRQPQHLWEETAHSYPGTEQVTSSLRFRQWHKRSWWNSQGKLQVVFQSMNWSTSLALSTWQSVFDKRGKEEQWYGVYCKSTNFGVLLYLANLANCVSSLIFVAANIYVDRTLHRRAAGRRQI